MESPQKSHSPTEFSSRLEETGSELMSESVTPASSNMSPPLNELQTNKDDVKILDADHPLMIRYQNDLKERLLRLHQQTDEQLTGLKRSITAQKKETADFAKQANDLEGELVKLENKLKKIHEKYEETQEEKKDHEKQLTAVKDIFQSVDEKRQSEEKKDLDFQKELEKLTLEVLQLTASQVESLTDTTTYKFAVEKTTKEKTNLELQKLRQDYLISRLENDKFNLEDRIYLYQSQCGIKKELVSDLKKELNTAKSEMETINFEKLQIMHQWKQSISALEKRDQNLSSIRDSVSKCEEEKQMLEVDIATHKKAVRRELERNEQLTLQVQHRESNIAQLKKTLEEISNREQSLMDYLTMLQGTIEMTEKDMAYLNSEKILNEKELVEKEKNILKSCSKQKSLENSFMDLLHKKLTITKMTKYTEKLIKQRQTSRQLCQEKMEKKDSEKSKLQMKLLNLQTYIRSLETRIAKLHEEGEKKETLLNRSEAEVLKNKEKMDVKRLEYKESEEKLHELIRLAGGQETSPIEREIGNLKKQITEVTTRQRSVEIEYLRYQRELVSCNDQCSERNKESVAFRKRMAILKEKKMQLEGDIAKEEKEIRDITNQIQACDNDIQRLNRLMSKKKELQEHMELNAEYTKGDFMQLLKEAELNSLYKESHLKHLKKKRGKNLYKLFEMQKEVVKWEGKIHVLEETKKLLKSEIRNEEMMNLKSDIRKLQLKLEKIKKQQDELVKEMSKAVETHTDLYVQAEKQSLQRRNRKPPEYVTKKLKRTKKKVQEDKKRLQECEKQLEVQKHAEQKITAAHKAESSLVSELMDQIHAFERSIEAKTLEKRQAVLKLSYKQKKAKLLENVKNGSYVKAIRNASKRAAEIEKLKSNFKIIEKVTHEIMNEHPELQNSLTKVKDFIRVANCI